MIVFCYFCDGKSNYSKIHEKDIYPNCYARLHRLA